MEFCNGGTLESYILEKKKIPEKEAILILKQILNGIAVTFSLFRNCTHTISSTEISRLRTYLCTTTSSKLPTLASPKNYKSATKLKSVSTPF